MKAFTVVMKVDSPNAEGFVALVRAKGEQGAKRAMTLFIGHESDEYLIFSVSSDMEKEIRGNEHCKEALVSDSLWDLAKAYQKAQKSDSHSKRKKASADLYQALGPVLVAFIFLSGAVLGQTKKRRSNA